MSWRVESASSLHHYVVSLYCRVSVLSICTFVVCRFGCCSRLFDAPTDRVGKRQHRLDLTVLRSSKSGAGLGAGLEAGLGAGLGHRYSSFSLSSPAGKLTGGGDGGGGTSLCAVSAHSSQVARVIM